MTPPRLYSLAKYSAPERSIAGQRAVVLVEAVDEDFFSRLGKKGAVFTAALHVLAGPPGEPTPGSIRGRRPADERAAITRGGRPAK